ncbi:Ccz1p KNAG_0B01280 [Huiozyma naganishii CBS 8797]|uniref:CCZ1/INTU/HSP4 first Longin domain-containing protein n=1 Tax=Huiozyma naganishii (strain ATCC MYA-139 / BCRC 22969 / CBS 8797 / KCTC 17520 / NBRC 10181 / NCYC 3082 / Yp74L-3) TaxID=1071383 RepID=J7R1A0_HUIN7|nr:hypothetical protein KNAG_0B01280 [Kazachstania naganishii CBS 8797]CCK68575.1 hypothetical protein KNAG_0B01280 [Kazachstania naganishii CBS 8797]
MSLQYFTVFDPERVGPGSENLVGGLLLYHEFGGADRGSSTLNEKLSRVGVVQGIWTLADTFVPDGVPSETERCVELGREVILTVRFEGHYFMCLSVQLDDAAEAVPHQFYMSQLWLSYKFFCLQFGRFDEVDMLVPRLNEHFVPFWNDIFWNPETLIRRGLELLWPNGVKMAEFDTQESGATEDVCWDSVILKDVILNETSYLGIKDLLVYHLPQGPQYDPQSYGLVRNFSTDLEDLADVSNWVYHLLATYGEISSHVLAGNAHYKEKPSEEHDCHTSTPPNSTQQESVMNSLSSYSNKFLHNLSLPVTFAYDAMQEMGATTGISNSMSLLSTYVPSWRSATESGPDSRDHSRYGFLISPLYSSALPMNYKVKQLNLNFQNDKHGRRKYNTLFWYYENILIVIVCDPTFEKIWDAEYLKDLGYTLSRSTQRLHDTVLKPNKACERKQAKFTYTVVEKSQYYQTVKSSIPSYGTKLPAKYKSALELAVNGDWFSNTDTSNWGFDKMGDIFHTNRDQERRNQTTAQQLDRNFLQLMPRDKLWELQLEILHFLDSLKRSRRLPAFTEERLLTLNNGVLCYIREEEFRLVIIVKNWFDMNINELKSQNSSRSSLFESLGKDVVAWWENLST